MKNQILQIIVPLIFASASLFAGTYSNLVYVVIENEISIIDTTSGISDQIIIPNAIEGLPVTSIKWNDVVRSGTVSISIPANVTNLITLEDDFYGNWLGYYNYDLSNITVSAENTHYASINNVLFSKDEEILLLYPGAKTNTSYSVPASVTTIADGAFVDIDHLRAIHLPEGVQTIGKYAVFSDRLETINFPSTLQTISEHAFHLENRYDQLSIGSIFLSEGLLYVGDEAFNIETLSQISFPSTITNIGTISHIYLLEAINVSSNNSYYSSIDGVLFDEDQEKLIVYPYRKPGGAYTIPETVKTIADSAFRNYDLSEIELPPQLLSIGDYAFYETGIRHPTIPASVTHIGKRAFNRACTFIVSPENQYYCNVDDILFNKDKTTLIQGRVYASVYKVLDTVQHIEANAMDGELLTLILPATIQSIGDSAFLSCSYLETVLFLGDAPTTGWLPFDPADVTINFYLASLGFTEPTWAGCTSQAISSPTPDIQLDFNYTNYTASITAYSLTASGDIILPETIEHIGQQFTVTSIGPGAFDGCSKISSLTIPDAIISIGASCFANCFGLETVRLPSQLITLETSLFSDCYNLQNVTLPPNLTEIGTSAFSDCYNLERITIPATVNTINSGAFMWCISLKSATFQGDAPNQFGSMVFAYTDPEFTVYFYETATGFTAPQWTPTTAQNYSAKIQSEISFSDWISQAVSPIDSSPLADPDHDGKNNFHEYAFCTDPTTNTLSNPLNLLIEQNHFQIEATINHKATDITYHLLFCPDLYSNQWETIATYTPRGTADTPQRTLNQSLCSFISFQTDPDKTIIKEEITTATESGYWRIEADTRNE